MRRGKSIFPLYMTEEELREIVRRSVDRWGSQLRWCQMHGVHQTHFSSFLAGRRRPGPEILKALNLEAVLLYRRIDRVKPRK